MQQQIKFSKVAVALLAVSMGHAAAEENVLPEVMVTATRTPTRTNELLSDTSTLTREDIERSTATNLTELLATLPGISLTANGGRGASTSLFMRGANPNHSLFLVDGQRISSATLGTTAFEHIPLDQIERIEVLRGPASSLYGADAIGGVIQIFTRKGGDAKPAPSFTLGAGSYGTSTGSVSYGGKIDDTRFAISTGWEEAHGPGAARNATSGFTNIFNPDDDPYRNANVSAHIAHQLSSAIEIGGDYLEARTKKDFDSTNCDSFFTTCTPDFDNRQTQALRSYSFFTNQQLAENWKSSLRLGRSDDKNESWALDPVAASVIADHFNTEQTQFSWQNDFTTSIGRFMAAAEWRKEKVDTSKGLVVDSRATKALIGGYQGNFGSHDVQLSARVDDIERIGTARSGSFAYGYRFDSGVRAHASIGRAFHAPTFNDLYWPVDFINFFQGNPSLKPERSFNREIGLSYDTTYSTTNLTLYHNKVTNLINFVPSFVPPFLGQNENVSSATLRGATFDYTLRKDDWLWRAHYDVLSARNDVNDSYLQRRVPHSAEAEVRRTLGQFDLGARATWTSRRFNDNANTQTLNSYSLLDLEAQYHLTPAWTLQGKIGNVFDKDYVLVMDQFSLNEFSTPGRNLFVTVRYQPTR